MNHAVRVALLAAVVAVAVAGCSTAAAAPSKPCLASVTTARTIGQPGLQASLVDGHFEPLVGSHSTGGFLFRGSRTLRVSARGIELAETPAGVPHRQAPNMRIVGARTRSGEGAGRLEGQSHYLLGAKPENWRRGVPHFESVRFKSVRPGVDLVYHENAGRLELDFVIEPGRDPERLRLAFGGAAPPVLDETGSLRLAWEGGEIVLRAPVAYQESATGRQPVESRFVWKGRRRVGFEVGGYDRDRPLVIDPVLEYSTFFGAAGGSQLNAVEVSDAHLIAAGGAESGDYPTTPGAFSPEASGSKDVVVTKISPDGSTVVWSTYLGGAGSDEAHGLTVDASGQVWLTGFTTSEDFPTVSPFQPELGGGRDAFVAKLSSDGASLLQSSYLGGAGLEQGVDLVVDAEGRATVAGLVQEDGVGGPSFPTVNALQPNPGADLVDIFVSQVGVGGTELLFSTYLGGSNAEAGPAGIALAPNGDLIVAGTTLSSDFPQVAPLMPWNGGTCDDPADPTLCRDAFLTRYRSDGQAMVYSTHVGGSGVDWGKGVAVDATGAAHLVGETHSGDFPIVGGLGIAPPELRDSHAFVARVSSRGDQLMHSTFLGGSKRDEALAIAVESNGVAHVTGRVWSADFPIREAFQSELSGGASALDGDAFVSRLNADASELIFSTYLGGSTMPPATPGYAYDQPTSVALGADGTTHVVGSTLAMDFPLENALQDEISGPTAFGIFALNGFISKISPSAASLVAEPSAIDQDPTVTPLSVTRDLIGRLVVGWEESMGFETGLYMGSIRSLFTERRHDHDRISLDFCGLVDASVSLDLPLGDHYFLAVNQAKPGPEESSYGRDSFGRERPPAAQPCP